MTPKGWPRKELKEIEESYAVRSIKPPSEVPGPPMGSFAEDDQRHREAMERFEAEQREADDDQV